MITSGNKGGGIELSAVKCRPMRCPFPEDTQKGMVEFSGLSIGSMARFGTNLIVWASRGEQFFCQTSKIKKKKKSNNWEPYSQSNLQLIMFFDITLYA